MIDTLRSEWPADMRQAATFPGAGGLERMVEEAVGRVEDYARENPVRFGLWALGVGFVLGWRMKPW